MTVSVQPPTLENLPPEPSTPETAIHSEAALPEEAKAEKVSVTGIMQKLAAGMSIAAALAGTEAMSGPFQTATTTTTAIDACPVLINGPSAENKLAHKATFGYFSGVEQDIVNQGYDAWLAAQINYTTLPGYATFKANLDAKYPEILYTSQSGNLCCGNFGMREARRQNLQRARVEAAVKSPAQLYERTVEFWTDHLNTFVKTPHLNRMKILEDREVIRANAFGKIYDILLASAKSPAMLLYLDGATNTKNSPNENYARELLELHSLGVDVCYDETTIQELAKVLTGWRVNTQVDTNPSCASPPPCGLVSFNASLHDQTNKTLIFPGCNTFTINYNSANQGLTEVDDFIDVLTNPFRADDFGARNRLAEATVRYIARKMATYFHSCNPRKSLIDAMWDAYKTAHQAGTDDIAAMLMVLLGRNNIHCSGPLFKRPLHLAASAIRATGSIINDPGDEYLSDTLMGGFLKSAGHMPYFWPAPNGYPPPCDIGYWSANLLARQNLGAAMFNIAPPYLINGVDSTPASTAVLAAATNQDVVDLVDAVMFGGFMPAFDKQRILDYMNSTVDIFARVEAMGMVIGSPGFQWY